MCHLQLKNNFSTRATYQHSLPQASIIGVRLLYSTTGRSVSGNKSEMMFLGFGSMAKASNDLKMAPLSVHRKARLARLNSHSQSSEAHHLLGQHFGFCKAIDMEPATCFLRRSQGWTKNGRICPRLGYRITSPHSPEASWPLQ